MNSELLKKDFGDVDLLDPEVHSDNPWPLYDWLREERPVYFDPINELWCVSRYDDIVEVSKHPELYTSEEGNVPKMPPDASFINMDGQLHLDRRKLIAQLFKPAACRKMEEHIGTVVDRLLDAVIEQGHCDFVKDIAMPLPVKLIADMTGIPEEWHESVREWMDIFMTGGNGPDHVTMEVNEAFINFGALHMQLCDERRIEPKDDLLTIWVNAEIDGKKMDEDALLFEHTMMMIGGSETSRNAISGAVLEMAVNPHHKEILIKEPQYLNNAAEESTRWVTPFIRMSRTMTRDTDLLGTKVKEGQELIMLYPAANRDPRKFDDPYTFDVRRSFKKTRSLAFGYGLHYCLGAYLALAEARVVFQRMLARMPDWQVAGEAIMARSSFIRGLTSLPIEFTPGPRVL